MRQRLEDWSDDDLDFTEKLLKREIEYQGAKDVFGYALQAVRTLRTLKAEVEEFEAYDPPGRCPWGCHVIGGPWIAENPDCPFHADGAKPVPKGLGERLVAAKEAS